MVVVVAEDLILEILFRVPPISVLRFKSVCKQWYSLISNPCFLRNHARQFHLLQAVVVVPPGLIFITEQHSVYAILPQDQDQDQDQDPNMLKVFLDHSLQAFKQKFLHSFIVNSCNGLLLYGAAGKLVTSNARFQYILFNPITNQYMEVPIMDLFHTLIKPEELEETVVLGLPRVVFDPSISLSYQILTILRVPPYTDFNLYLYAYSSITVSWRFLTKLPNNYNLLSNYTFMFDGVFYWLTHNGGICYDVVKETVWFQPLPPIPARYANREVIYFGGWGGGRRLRLIQQYYNYLLDPDCCFPYSFDIMEKELGGSTVWTLKFRVNIEAGYDHLIREEKKTFVKVRHLYETEKGEEVVLLNIDNQKIVSFNITTSTFGKELTIPNITTNTFGKKLTIPNFEHYDAFSFTPTLFPLLT